ncbi:GntR family transcriptional regulator [Pseudomonas sp. TCU-HL1]|uniref:GntR family transcriptional regulator n=1 Tax=Pseudomonas sp. TCU-HL1 TaxID=1856685 RepID=UPI00083D3579|nr:GntR family transcriptional regulator [Pseudomonas sp. TCU-HL1]
MLNVPNLGNAPSTSEVILKFLRNAIIKGEIREDEPIRQDDIARAFNVSKIPVREALKRLEAEGLVEFHRNRGALVTRISEFELAQIFEVRVLLEVQLIKQAIPYLTEADFKRAEATLQEFMKLEDTGRWAELNWAFHAALYEAAQRPFVLNMVRSIHDKIERYLRMQIELSDDGKAHADEEHRAILAACRAKNAKLAGKLVEEHIHSVCDALFAHLPKGPAKS